MPVQLAKKSMYRVRYSYLLAELVRSTRTVIIPAEKRPFAELYMENVEEVMKMSAVAPKRPSLSDIVDDVHDNALDTDVLLSSDSQSAPRSSTSGSSPSAITSSVPSGDDFVPSDVEDVSAASPQRTFRAAMLAD